MPADHSELERTVRAHRPLLLGLCYRMLGSRAQAEDCVQDTFERALRTPPRDAHRDIKPWLVRVALNLCKDKLRARARRRTECWLPEPLETAQAATMSTATGARYDQLESLSVAFLCAVEALGETQRAVLLLRDVFDFTVRETAEALDLTEANVKTTLHRARTAMAAYDRRQQPLTPARIASARRAIEALFFHAQTGNTPALRELLAADVVVRNDADDGRYAARRLVRGVDRVLLFLRKTSAMHRARAVGVPRAAIRLLNGEPAMVLVMPSRDPRMPARSVTWLQLDATGRIEQLASQVDVTKLPENLFEDLPPLGGTLLARGLRASLQVTPPRTWLPAAVRTVARSGLSSMRRRVSGRG